MSFRDVGEDNIPSRETRSFQRRYIHRDDLGVSPILGTMLILLLMVTMITSILLWAAPMIDEFEDTNQYNSMKGLMESIDHRIDYLMTTGDNSSVNMNLMIPPGTLGVANDREFWLVSFNYLNPLLSEEDDFFYGNFQKNPSNNGGNFVLSSSYNRTVDVLIKWVGTDVTEGQYEIHLNKSIAISTINDIIETFSVTVMDHQRQEPLSQCMVFSVNHIEGNLKCPSGRFDFIGLNGGVMTEYPNPEEPRAISPPEYVESVSITPQIPDLSNKYSTGDCLILNIMDFSSTGLSIAGEGNYGLDLAYPDIRMNDVGEVRNVRLHVYGKYQQCIYNDYSQGFSKGFSEISGFSGFMEELDSGTILYKVSNPTQQERENVVNLVVNEHFFTLDLYKK
ncbi:MAG: hypothetical protein QGH39_06385 [Candidatus Thermoplasmatota archaeon]|jgi:hypothetical protein|nr:hypothetical protein [Candidatus Thermoplasmatota archaeon]MDP7265171.1 hypothetical protein [Candidatus Thermoplasmatota archaeon]